MAQSMYAIRGAVIVCNIDRSCVRLPEPFGVPSAITKYPYEAISAIAVAFERPFLEHPPSPQTKLGYFSVPPRSVGRKIVPSLIPAPAFVSTVTLWWPVPVALGPAGGGAGRGPGGAGPPARPGPAPAPPPD